MAGEPWVTNCDANRKALSLCTFAVSVETISISSAFFISLYMHIALGQGQTTSCGQNVDAKIKIFLLCIFIASFK